MEVPMRGSAAGTSRRLPHGQIVVRQGDPSDCLYLVTAGAVRLSSVTRDGREIVAGILGVGDVFGESALLGRPSPVEARTIGDTDVVPLPISHVRATLRHNPGTAEELLRLVAFRLHRTSIALEEALLNDLPARVSGRLLELARAHGVPVEDGVAIAIPLTQDEIARMVGATREAVNRTIGGLAARGLVRSRARSVVICDPAALAEDGVAS